MEPTKTTQEEATMTNETTIAKTRAAKRALKMKPVKA